MTLISPTILRQAFPMLQQPFESTGLPLWIWLAGIFLVILVGVVWTLYEEE